MIQSLDLSTLATFAAEWSYCSDQSSFTADALLADSDKLLNVLSAASKDPQLVSSVAAQAYPLLVDCAARWLETVSIDNHSNTIHEIAQSFGRLLPLAPQITPLALLFWDKHRDGFYASLLSKTLSDDLRLASLLALFRHLQFDYKTFSCIIDTFSLASFLHSLENVSSDSASTQRYIISDLLVRRLGATERKRIELVSKSMRESSPSFLGTYDGIRNVDFTMVTLLEANRIAKGLNAISNAGLKDALIRDKLNLSPLVCDICGILVPNISSTSTSPTTSPLESKLFSAILTPTTVHNIRSIAMALRNASPLLISGPAGCGKTFLIDQLSVALDRQPDVIRIHLGEQTDAKLLVGNYSTGETSGSFEWRYGVLSKAVRDGKWVLIEDLDKAPNDILSVLLPLLERNEIFIPSRAETISAGRGFRLIATTRNTSHRDLVGGRFWRTIELEPTPDFEITTIIEERFPLLSKLASKFVSTFNVAKQIFADPTFIVRSKVGKGRTVYIRDLFKWVKRANTILQAHGIASCDVEITSRLYDDIFMDALDCFAGSLSSFEARRQLVDAMANSFEVSPQFVSLLFEGYSPRFLNTKTSLDIGRIRLQKYQSIVTAPPSDSAFAVTQHSKRLFEKLCVAINMQEPLLLVGETGTGKTTVVQQISKMMNTKLIVINASQQTEASDLLGGFKPIDARVLAVPLKDEFESLFEKSFSLKRNTQFISIFINAFVSKKWPSVIRIWRQAIKMAYSKLDSGNGSIDSNSGKPPKRQKVDPDQSAKLLDEWLRFSSKVDVFEAKKSQVERSFVFSFVEGQLIQAVRNGYWILLDEINLAAADTLESISELLVEDGKGSILLSEKGEMEVVRAHPNFRLFACMNPATDIGKKDLPLGIRSRFTEIYVPSPDENLKDLMSIVNSYIGNLAVSDAKVCDDVVQLYAQAKLMTKKNMLVDGANTKAHFSVRTLARTLSYAASIASTFGLRRALYEGFCMNFLTQLNKESEKLLNPIIERYTLAGLKNSKSVLSRVPPAPGDPERFVQIQDFWIERGPLPSEDQSHYIITPFVEKNLRNVVRAVAGKKFPVLLQGPTSSGKTSIVNYLAKRTGHKFVRINNHEHTDLQEYLGSYVSDSEGVLRFHEGLLVEALRKGYWIVLDELNLAPSEVLEALNRLLDDNRELLIPETQEVVKPHPHFMLFAAQNPPGLYGGRKVLSRAFRNRFLELHFDDIPEDDLEIILRERCKIAPTYAKRIIQVYQELASQRQSTRLFEQRYSFATLRDLFRWADRPAVGYEELATNGYLLLGERVRNPEERTLVKRAIEKVMRTKINAEYLYFHSESSKSISQKNNMVIWTKAMLRLFYLVREALKNNEPVLLVGETGCGKTTVCQILASISGKQLHIVNAHQNTETGDLIGSQRPVRGRQELGTKLKDLIISLFELCSYHPNRNISDLSADELFSEYRALKVSDNSLIGKHEELAHSIDALHKRYMVLFEWHDGSLVQALREGSFFLLDEISLADDSVLERLNSVLETERTLTLAGSGLHESVVTATEGFQFLATMNPGGDYGKKELSPALRNRFTEIWVPSLDDFSDVLTIIESKLTSESEALSKPICVFAEWFYGRYADQGFSSCALSLRDVLAWVTFINSTSASVGQIRALAHGAALVFLDSLGTNNTSYMATIPGRIMSERNECLQKLSSLVDHDLSFIVCPAKVSLSGTTLKAGDFSIPIWRSSQSRLKFNFDTPTTANNVARVIRGMQLHKPILLEGSPGVGKTSLVTALASACGRKLTRINLSEQTDLMDLFGSDVPVEGGRPGEFTWSSAPFLTAMEKGEWVLLDEMNLASQSVLEGLNACLDHRGETYIPELDKTFTSHPNFTVFAAQNPHSQGGGRKGLPKSFVNRFTVVYVDLLDPQDLVSITTKLYPPCPSELVEKVTSFMSILDTETSRNRSFGSHGGPWEFNLRDAMRYLDLLCSKKDLEKGLPPYEWIDVVIKGRFRSNADKKNVDNIYSKVFGHPVPRRSITYSFNAEKLRVGHSVLTRQSNFRVPDASQLNFLQCNLAMTESLITSVNYGWASILVGPPASGKSSILKSLASIAGVRLEEFAMNSEVDSVDIIGSFEQEDLTRKKSAFLSKVDQITTHLYAEFNCNKNGLMVAEQGELLCFLRECLYRNDCSVDVSFEEIYGILAKLSQRDDCLVEFSQLHQEAAKLNEERLGPASFEWFDGVLVQALEKGFWLVLDNANLCSPTVLDRLNSLLEPDGVLIVNERRVGDGQPKIVTPHKNFRLFLTMDPRYGELSRAMRNRCVEIYFDPLFERLTWHDRKLLSQHYDLDTADLADSMVDLSLSERVSNSKYCSSSFLNIEDSRFQLTAIIDEFLHCSFTNPESDVVSASYWVSPLELDHLRRWQIASYQLHFISKEVSEYYDHLFLITSKSYDQRNILEIKMNDIYERAVQVCTSYFKSFKDNLPYSALLDTPISRIIFDAPEMNQIKESLALLREIWFRAHSFSHKLENMKTSALSIKPRDRSYIEKSMIARISNLSDIEAVRISKLAYLLEASARLAITLAEGALQSLCLDNILATFKLVSLNLDTYQLTVHKSVDESQLRVVNDFFARWIRNHRTPATAELESQVNSFDNNFTLTTGVLMEDIWAVMKPNLPLTEEGWSEYQSICELVQNFDEISNKLSPGHFKVICQLKRKLLDLVSRLSANETGASAIETMKHTVRDLSQSLSQNLATTAHHSSFDTLYEYLVAFQELDMSTRVSQNNERRQNSLMALVTYGHQRTLLLRQFYESSPDRWASGYVSHIRHFLNIGGSVYGIQNLMGGGFISSLIKKRLEMEETSMKDWLNASSNWSTFTEQISERTPIILNDRVSQFCRLLFKRFEETFEYLSQIVDEKRAALFKNVLSGLLKLKFYEMALPPLEDFVCKDCIDDAWYNYFYPSLKLVQKSYYHRIDDRVPLRDLARAWILFSSGLLKLYVPNAPLDPAIKPYVENHFLAEETSRVTKRAESESFLGSIYNGSTYSTVTTALESQLATMATSTSVAFRPSVSQYSSLHAEISSIWSSTLSNSLVESITNSACQAKPNAKEAMASFQRNTDGFLTRVANNFPYYRDVTLPLEVMICDMKVGFGILDAFLKTQFEEEDPNSLVWSVDQTFVVNTESIDERIEALHYHDMEKPVSYSTVIYLLSLCRLHNAVSKPECYVDSPCHDPLLNEMFMLWSVLKDFDEKASANDKSLYKYSNDEAEDDEDFHALFPDYENGKLNDSSKRLKSTKERLESDPRLMHAYMNLLTDQTITLDEVLALGFQIVLDQAKSSEPVRYAAGDMEKLYPPFLAQNALGILNSQKKSGSFNFYTDSDLGESHRCCELLTNLQIEVNRLIREWPDNMVLQDIANACDVVLEGKMSVPLAKLLQQTEAVHKNLNEWEKVASKEVSLRQYYDAATELIVSWRKEELSCWARLMDFQEEECSSRVSKWWFYLYENIIFLPSRSSSDKTAIRETLPDILNAVTLFIGQSSLGEFSTRLSLLDSFSKHALKKSEIREFHVLQKIGNALKNLIAYFSQFLPAVRSTLSAARRTLEKEMNDVILLASWKDVNIDALRESSRRSHYKLYKIIRKYRSSLNEPIKFLLDGDIPKEGNSEPDNEAQIITCPFSSYLSKSHDIERAMRIYSSSQFRGTRPDRLVEVERTERIMKRYIDKLGFHDGHSLKEYVKQVVEDADALRKETPNILNDDTKKHIQQLKSRKRKLLSDTQKDLKEFGIRENVRPDILVKQSSVNSVIASMGAFDKSMQGTDFFFLQILHYLPSLRAKAASHFPDLSTPEVERGMGQIENLFHMLLEKRNGITGVLADIKLCEKLADVISAYELSEDIQLIVRPELGLPKAKSTVLWAPHILKYFCDFIEMKSKLDKEDYSVLINCLRDWEQKFLSIFDGINPMWIRPWGFASSKTKLFLEKSTEMLEHFRSDLLSAVSTCPGFKAISEYLLSALQACEARNDYDDFLRDDFPVVFEYLEVDVAAQNLCNSILVAIQTLNSIDTNTEEVSDWYTASHSASLNLIKALHVSKINDRLQKLIMSFKAVSHGDLLKEHSDFVLALFTMCVPFIKAFLEASEKVISHMIKSYYESSKALYYLIRTLSTLFTKGFCGPEDAEKEHESQGTKSGSALGEGEGAETREADEDDQEALEDMTKGDKNEDESGDIENDKTQDVEGDFEGVSEDLDPNGESDSDDMNNEDSLDSEVGDEGDLDPDAVDEKMWDEEAGEDGKEKEANEQTNTTEGNDLEARPEENEENLSKDEQKEDQASSEDKENDMENMDDEVSDGATGADEDDIRPQNDDDSAFQAPEVDTMDLPEDINLDQEGEKDKDDEADEMDEEGMEDSIEISDSEDKKDQMRDFSDEDTEERNNEQNLEDQIGDENDMLDFGDLENKSENEGLESPGEEHKEEDRSDIEEEQNSRDNENQDLSSRADESNEDGGSGTKGIEENTLMEEDENAGEQSTGMNGQEDSVADDRHDAEQKSEMREQSRNDLTSEQIQKENEESFQNAANSLQQLGNALEEYYGHRDIQEASENQAGDKKETEKADIRNQDVQHVEGSDSDYDSQALGNATDKMRQDDIDQSAAVEEDISEPKEDVTTKPFESDDKDGNMETDEVKRTHNDVSDTSSFLAQNPSKSEEIMDLDVEEKIDSNDQLVEGVFIERDETMPYRDLDDARSLWTQHERETLPLVTSLCEQLRLILAPTLSTKLRGDFRTGKRLNLKRIIPYIASDFKKDKIWLRRTKPSKREYQIMIAVDDSKSMAEPVLSNLAFDSIALVSKALTQLESGQISIVSFGEQTRLVHPFQTPFTPEAGARAFQWFGFNQTRTDVQSLATSSLKYFEEARLQSSTDLWQLEIIISDGMCEDHESLRRIVRRAREEKVMMVFVIVDTVENGSILETSQARYEQDEEGNMTLKVEKYLDKFPFEYYLIVRNVVELPGVLSTVLRQYFAQVSELDQ